MYARSRRIQRRRRTNRKNVLLRVLAIILIAVLVVALSGVAVAAAAVNTWLDNLPDPNAPGAFDVAQATRIYSSDGKLLARIYLENRTVIPIAQMSPDLPHAVVAVEDERFYKHNGVDMVGLARAVVMNLTEGFGAEGASTITQQYIRNTILLDEALDVSIKRKVREAYLAIELEKRYDKQQILEMYLNAIYFGEGAHGAEAASRTYFSKHANELTLAESALLAGLPQQPGRLDPYEYPDAAIKRRNVVLSRMLEQKYITQAQYDEAVATPLQLKRSKDPEDGIYQAPFYVAHVKKLLQQRFSKEVVFGGGLKVYTALDTRLQGYAEEAMHAALPAKGPEGALVSINPKNGHVVALVGGKNYRKNKFNLATQGHRQAGSAFKTFTLVTALDLGVSPSTMVDSSSPARIPTKPRPWIVSNSEGRGSGSMSFRSATAASVNTVFARVAWAIGAKKIVKMANKMGIETPLKAYPSLTLGAQNVTPLEMTSAYATLANNGKHYDPVFITKVVDKNGQVILDVKPEGKQVVKRTVAYAATQVLKGVISGGTATRARIGRPAAGKTGTSQDHRDVWFVGYTPQLATGIWVGHRTEKTIYLHGGRAFGGTVCAPIWRQYMTRALKGKKVVDFKSAPSPKWHPSRFKIPRGSVETSKTPDKKKDKTKPTPVTPVPTPPTPVTPDPSTPTSPTP
ncbi:MAG TPA: PBP1A family penicillin-binding protein [Coriobacteriia bacterium]|nr:PBP1A family penicillin-binding protein [Coriobacteriia bacterium]